MGVVQGAGDRPQQPHDLLKLRRAAHAVGESASLDQLHDQVGNASVLAKVECAEDVGVVEPRHRLRFELKALPVALVLGEEFGQHLDRDEAVECRVVRAIDGRHTAPTNPVHDSIRTDERPFGHAHSSSLVLTTLVTSATVTSTRPPSRTGMSLRFSNHGAVRTCSRLTKTIETVAMTAGASMRAEHRTTSRAMASGRPSPFEAVGWNPGPAPMRRPESRRERGQVT